MCRVQTALLLLLAAACGGCASYTETGWPGRAGHQAMEFAPGVEVRANRQVRITTVADQVFTGALVAWDSLTVTIVPGETQATPLTLTAAEISRFEVYSPASWRPLRKAALVLVGATATYVFIDEMTRPKLFSPDTTPAKHP